MRLDKLLCDMNKGTRSQIKKDIKAGLVTVNGTKITKPEFAVQEKTDQVCYQGQPCVYEKYVYYMLHKPSGVVSATEDKRERTVIDLLFAEGRDDLFPVGRLDKDTEGLLIITNDGELAHALLSPKKHVEKEYECHLAHTLTAQQIEKLEQGVDIGEKNLTKPAKVRILSGEKTMRSKAEPDADANTGIYVKTDTTINSAQIISLTITEGKFHQVKRMLKAVENEVVYLKRIRMGNLVLDDQLDKGAYRRLEEWEVEELMNTKERHGCV
ncbi:MAG: rRNA pseudouridine synthase [Lachnospiraceae bacterium]|nr:rRNA pseudouridine synthase [Lachnospiraceae bacterium]